MMCLAALTEASPWRYLLVVLCQVCVWRVVMGRPWGVAVKPSCSLHVLDSDKKPDGIRPLRMRL
jgi:hypothetical protein